MDDKFSVWVGSLSLQCKEETLSDFFGKFGPLKSVVVCRDELGKSRQFGFVNYYNREIAECAATVMDGCKLLGQAIKTKGPSELQKRRNEQNGGAKKDCRMYTDCLFFIDGRECTWDSGECLFRHCDAVKKTEMVCEKWLKRQCEDVQCPLRHPRLAKPPAIVDTTVNRCPSHNAFKCFGECGNRDCNTHFLEHSAYHEHVKMAMKKLAQPLDTCSKCQAVFFNQEERMNHRCYKSVLHPPLAVQQFTSTRLKAEKDIVYPQPMYPNKTHTNPNAGPLFTQHFDIQKTDINNEKNYLSSIRENDRISKTISPKEMHGYSPGKYLSTHNTCNTSDFSSGNLSQKQNSNSSSPEHCPMLKKANVIGSVNLPNHMQKSAIAFSACKATISHENLTKELEPVGVFWDLENCAVPKGKCAHAVVQKIRSVFFKNKREAEFMCVCDTSKEKKSVIEELNKAQVTVVHINATSKNAADDKLRQSLRRFAQTFCRPATVILISGDVNFAMDLSDLRHRHNFQVVCLHNVHATSGLLGFAHETHRFDLFTEDLQTFTSGQVPCKPSFSNDVLVTNVPTTKNPGVLKGWLNKLSDNCGGKVVAINGNKAIVRFPNTEAAFRARRRLDKEKLFGYTLRATLLPLTNSKDGEDMTSAKRKPKENTSPATISRASPLVKPLMDVSLNENTNSKSCKENRSPNINPAAANFPGENAAQNSPPLLFQEPLANASPPFPQFNGQRFPGPFMFNNMFHPTLFHNMFGMRGGGQAPSPIPLSTPPSPLPTPPSPVLNGMVRPPSPEQQYSGVDLLVTNINENVPKKEIKKKLASVFREHCKVYSVVLHAKNGAPLRAFVKVPKIMDAHMAISKVTGKVVLGQVVKVSLATERDKELCYLQDEAVAVLQEAPLSWLPLATFSANFEKKYRRHLDGRHLEQIRDAVVVNGSTGCQTISLLEGKIDSEFLIVDSSFASDVFKLLHHYDGVIALVSFPALYWLEFDKEIELCSTGSLLEELLCRIPNVTVAGSDVKRSIQWVRKPCPSTSNPVDLSVLSSQVVEVLQQDHEFEMSFERLKGRYLSRYDKELEPSCYGFQSLLDLMHSLTSIVQIKEDQVKSYVCLLREYRVKLFRKEISDLLMQQSNSPVLLSNFMASYVKHFGQKFKLSSFGFTRLTDLIKAVSDVAGIEGDGDQRTVTLIHKNSSTERESEESSEQEDLEMFSQPHEVVHTVEQVQADLLTMVDGQENKLVYVRNISKFYESCFRRKFPYAMSLLNEALQSLDRPLEVRGTGSDSIVGIFNGTEDASPSKDDFVFVKTAVEILYQCEEYTMAKERFQCLYQEKICKNKNIDENDARLDCFPSCVLIRNETDKEVAELRCSYRIRILVEELKWLLASADDHSITLDELLKRYEDHFGKTFDLELYGLLSVEDLKEKMNGFIEIGSSENDTDRLALAPVSRFEMETKTLLERCHGCLSLSRFAPVYQQMYSKPCIVSDYGYTKLSSLINAVHHVARIIGSGPEKVVIAVQRSIPERVCSDMLSLRIIGSSTEELFSSNKGKQTQENSVEDLSSFEETVMADKVNTSNSYLPEQKSYMSKTSDDDVVNSFSNVTPRQMLETKRGKVDCKVTETMTSPVTSYGMSEMSFPAGQGLTNKMGKVNNSSRGRISARTTSSKVRLAANFTFPPHEKR